MIGYPTLVRQLLILLALAAPASARQTSLTPEMDRLVTAGIDAIYRMDFDAADEAARKAMALNPDYPHAYLGAAATDFIRYVYGPTQSDDARVKSFEKKTEVAISVAERWLKTHPGDADVMLVLGSGYGIRARLALERREYVKGWRNGSRSMKSIRAAVKADPQMYDSYLGLGMFDYYVDTIPRFAGWLAKIMLGGDRARGLQELRLAAEKGHFARSRGAADPRRDRHAGRVRRPRHVRRRAPDDRHPQEISEFIHAPLRRRRRAVRGRRLRGGTARGEGIPGAGRIREIPGREHVHGARAERNLAVGVGRRQGAGAGRIPRRDRRQSRTRWIVWNRVRAGQIFDLLGRRDEALAAYKSAYAEPDKWGFKAVIKDCLSKPCVGSAYPGLFSP